MSRNWEWNLHGKWEPNTLQIKKVNEVHMKIEAEPVIKQELSDFFTFVVPNARFTPAYKSRMWDGKIRLFDNRTSRLYLGLFPYVEHFARERNYDINKEDDVGVQEEFSVVEAKEFVESLKLPHTIRDYQLDSFIHCIRNNRSLIVSPTASGKSLIIYTILNWYADARLADKALIIVPTISLVQQMATDFVEYGCEKDEIHQITAGADKETNKRIVISTWQSLQKMPWEYFQQYDTVVGDECHLFKAKSLTEIMTKLTNTKYRFGFTGTLDGTQTHKLVLEGLFGKVKQFVKTKDLIDREQLANFRIKALLLTYTEEERKLVSKMKYQDEMDFLVGSQKRNHFIQNLALSLTGNTLLLFQYVEKHGKILHDLITSKAEKNRKVFFVYGGTDADTREQIRSITEQEKNAIIIASYGTFSTGINIRNLHNIVFGSPSKSRIRNLQSIGRGLRLGDNKETATLFDIADDLRWKKSQNYTLSHFIERMKLYHEEEFECKQYTINI